MKSLTSDSIKYSRELAGDYEDLNEVVDFMEKFSSIEEELMYVNKEEEERRLKNLDVNIAHKEGKLEGELASKKETIKNSINLGLTLEQVSKLVDMPIDEVEKIQNELKVTLKAC